MSDSETFAALCVWEWVVENLKYTNQGLVSDRYSAIVLGGAIEQEWASRGWNYNDQAPFVDVLAFDLEFIPLICEKCWNKDTEIAVAFEEVLDGHVRG